MRNTTLYAVFGLVAIAGIIGVSYQATTPQPTSVSTFSDADDFRSYLAAAEQQAATSRLTGSVGQEAARDTTAETPATDDGAAAGGSGGEAVRSSTTNVQVEGIDEPDIVKTDGRRIFYSRQSWQGQGNTSVITAYPPEELARNGSVPAAGELFLDDDQLVVLGDQQITAYDVAGSSRERLWQRSINGSLVSARQYDGSIYLVVREDIDRSTPCPVPVMDGVRIGCSSIYHPGQPIDADVTYSLLKLDQGGDATASSSFVGSSSQSVVYMSRNGIYVTYTEEASEMEAMMDFLDAEGQQLLDDQTYQRIQQLQEYDISQQAKYVELQYLLQQYLQSLDDDAALEFKSEFENGFGNFTDARMRQYTTTGIVRAGLDDLQVDTTGEVPGSPLNQFSMSEHEGNLRIATTVTAPGSWTNSANDLYVLDEDLERIGAVQDMGLDERIYSVRYAGDQAYVVTFRQIDPFHVLDLSDPRDPTVEGELKLPGYSSYLHPLGNDTVLGIGREEGNVKAVLFDVSDPTNPVIGDTYRLDAYWSGIEETHHAFLHDPRHDVFFLPAGDGGYIFSYQDGLELEKAVSMRQPERAVYIGDHLYVIGRDQIRVVDETDWSITDELDLPRVRQDYPEPIPLPGPRPIR